ncbi:MAG: hypothetical protein R6W82_04165 [bacterium]
MRSEDEVREKLEEIQRAFATTTDHLSRGRIEALDFTGIAGRVGIIQALEWVLGETDELKMQINPLRRDLGEE